MRDVIAGYGLPWSHRGGERLVVTAIERTPGKNPQREVHRWEPPVIRSSGAVARGDVLFNLPLNGAWSDLTARFELQQRHGALFLVLEEIQVF